MGNVLIDESILQGWADVIREKQGIEDKMKPSVLLEKTREIESGGSGGGLAYDMGEFVLDTDSLSVGVRNGGIPHKLGAIPRFIVIWTDDLSYLSEDNPYPYTNTTNIGCIYLSGITGLTQRLTSSVNNDDGVFLYSYIPVNNYRVIWDSPTSISYTINKVNDNMPTEDKIFLPRYGTNNYWRAGVTYKYFVSRNWWEVANRVE